MDSTALMDYSHFLALMNNATMNMHVQVLCGCMLSILLGICQETELLIHMVNLTF